MVKRDSITELPDYAAACLTCACRNGFNAAAQRLLGRTEALSAIGVVAAIFIADSVEHRMLVKLARAAIEEQRSGCFERKTPAPDFCMRPPEHRRTRAHAT